MIRFKMPAKIFPMNETKGKRTLAKDFERVIKANVNKLINELLRDPFDYEHKYNIFEKYIFKIKIYMSRYGKMALQYPYWLELFYRVAAEFNFDKDDLYFIFQDTFFKWRWPNENSSFHWPEKEFAYERWLLNKRGFIKAFRR